MDSRDKRAAAIHTSLPWRGIFPVADGGVSRADRFQAANLYRASSESFVVVTVLGSVRGPRAAGNVNGPRTVGSVRG